MEDPYQLVHLLRKQARVAVRRYGAAPRKMLSVAFCGVVGYGTVLDSGEEFDDPPSTWRVSQYSLTGPILLPATGEGRAAKPLLRRFTTPYDVAYVPSLVDASPDDVEDVPSLVDASPDDVEDVIAAMDEADA